MDEDPIPHHKNVSIKIQVPEVEITSMMASNHQDAVHGSDEPTHVTFQPPISFTVPDERISSQTKQRNESPRSSSSDMDDRRLLNGNNAHENDSLPSYTSNETIPNYENVQRIDNNMQSYESSQNLTQISTPKSKRNHNDTFIGIDNPAFHADDMANGHGKRKEKDGSKMGDDKKVKEVNGQHNTTITLGLTSPNKATDSNVPEAVNLELVNMAPLGKSNVKSVDNNGGLAPTVHGLNNIPLKKDTEVDLSGGEKYDEYFVPVNEHRKYMRGEKLIVTKDKRIGKVAWKTWIWWAIGAILFLAVIFAILSAAGVFTNDNPIAASHDNATYTESQSRSFDSQVKAGGFFVPDLTKTSSTTQPTTTTTTESSTEDFGDWSVDSEEEKTKIGDVAYTPSPSTALPAVVPTTDDSMYYVPKAVEGELKIDNRQWDDNLANPESEEFKKMAASLEKELKETIFDYQTLNYGGNAISVKVVGFEKGSVIVKYRIVWDEKPGIRGAPDPINETNLKDKLTRQIHGNFYYLGEYKIAMDSIATSRVLDRCQVNRDGCQFDCQFDKPSMDFVCSCPPYLKLHPDGKVCITESVPEPSLETRFEPTAEPTSEPSAEPTSEPEPEPKAAEPTPEPKSEPSAEPTAEPTSEPTAEPKAEPSAEPTAEPAPEPTTQIVPIPKSEPTAEPAAEPTVEPTAEPKAEPTAEPTAKTTPEPKSEPSAEPTTTPLPESKIEAKTSIVVKSEVLPTSEPTAEPTSEPSAEPAAEPTAEPAAEPTAEPAAEPTAEPAAEPTAEPAAEPSAEPTSEPIATKKEEQKDSNEPRLLTVMINPEIVTKSSTDVPLNKEESHTTLESSRETSPTPEPTSASEEKAKVTTEQSMKSSSRAEVTNKSGDSKSFDTVVVHNLAAASENGTKTEESKTTSTEKEAKETTESTTVSNQMLALPEDSYEEKSQSQGRFFSEDETSSIDHTNLHPGFLPEHIHSEPILPEAEYTVTENDIFEAVTPAMHKTTTETGDVLVKHVINGTDELKVSISNPAPVWETNENDEKQNNRVVFSSIALNTTASVVENATNPTFLAVPDNTVFSNPPIVITNNSETSTVAEKSFKTLDIPLSTTPEDEEDDWLSQSDEEEEKPSLRSFPTAANPSNHSYEVTEANEDIPTTTQNVILNHETATTTPTNVLTTMSSTVANHVTTDAPEVTTLKSTESTVNTSTSDVVDMIDNSTKIESTKTENVTELHEVINKTSNSSVAELESLKKNAPRLDDDEQYMTNPQDNSTELSENFNTATTESDANSGEELSVVPLKGATKKFDEVMTADNKNTTYASDVKEILETKKLMIDDEEDLIASSTEITNSEEVQKITNTEITTLGTVTKANNEKLNDTKTEVVTKLVDIVMQTSTPITIETKSDFVVPTSTEGPKIVAEVVTTDKTVESIMTTVRNDVKIANDDLNDIRDNETDDSIDGEQHLGVVPLNKPVKKIDKKREKDLYFKSEKYEKDSGVNKIGITKQSVEETTTTAVHFLAISPLTNQSDSKEGANSQNDDDDVILYSKCAAGQFQCKNGTSIKDAGYCVALSDRCDSISDCTDASDEDGCDLMDCPGNYKCQNGQCLKRHLVCNGILDCDDGSDEESCENWKCIFDEWSCEGDSKRCIPVPWRCDGRIHCPSGSDEAGCQSDAVCTNGQFHCTESRMCIPEGWRCDGKVDCMGGDDERLCDCGLDEFKCKTGGGCVPKSLICDGEDNCPDLSDEWDCIKLSNTSRIDREDLDTIAVESTNEMLRIRRDDDVWMQVCYTNASATNVARICEYLGYAGVQDVQGVPAEVHEKYVTFKNTSSKINVLYDLEFTNKCDSGEAVAMSCQEFECGTHSQTDMTSGRVVGGDHSGEAQWPSIALMYNDVFNIACTASVVTPRWLLASRTCVLGDTHGDIGLEQERMVGWSVHVGKTTFNPSEDLSNDTYIPKKIISFSGVKYNQVMYNNDLIGVMLDKSLTFNRTSDAICVADQDVEQRQLCVTAGWGVYQTNVSSKYREFRLNYLPLPIMDRTECNSTRHYNGLIRDSHICAGYTDGEKAPCYNDEGAPLMCFNDAESKWELHGLLSYHSDCGRTRHPPVFTSLTSKPLKDWLHGLIPLLRPSL